MKILLLGDSKSPHLHKWENSISVLGTEFLTVDIELFKSKGSSLLKFIRLFALYVKASFYFLIYRPDIVHAHYATSYGLIAACLPTRKVIVSAWGSDILFWRTSGKLYYEILRFVLNRAVYVFADSQDLIKNCQEIIPSTQKYKLVNWGINLDQIPVSTQGYSEIRLISTRNFEAIYNIAIILDAFEIASEASSKKLTLDVYGKGSLQAEVEAKIKQSKFRNNIQLKGFKPLTEVYLSLSQSTCMISIPSSDGTASSLLEAMAAGLYIICSELPSNREWVLPETGTFLKDISPANLASVILKLNEFNQKDLEIIAQKNRAIIQERANPKTEFKKVLHCYEQTISFSESV